MAEATRLHAMDNLRAAMMWLGVVLHVADLHVVGPAPLAWRDPARTLVADLMAVVIHAFRMPVFFMVAGFFVALLAVRRGPSGMLWHRLRRVGLPLVLFWPPIFGVMVVLSTLHAQPPGSVPVAGFDLGSMPVMPDGSRLQTMHLWFLEVLMGLVAATAAAGWLARQLPQRLLQQVQRRVVDVALQPLILLLLVGVLTVNTRNEPFGILSAEAAMFPRVQEWLHYGLFFAYGMVLYAGRERMLPLLQAGCTIHGLLGAGLLVLTLAISAGLQSGLLQLPRVSLWLGMAYNGAGLVWSLALIGAFARWFNRRSPVSAYLADSSYWAYLVHLPCIVAVELVLRVWEGPALVKMGLNVLVTTAFCLVSYQLLVRHTPVGVLLNGRRAANRPTA